MTKVKVLIEGYARKTKAGWLASSTVTLIEDCGKKIIVDPGINRELLLARLEKEGLQPENIDFIFMTHYHPDHVFLAAIFAKAEIFDGNTIYKNDKETEYKGKVPGTNLKVILTPGHAHEHASLLAKTAAGRIVVAGDVFWWTDDEEQKTDEKSLLGHPDPFTVDKNSLIASRQKILKIADQIIPGHGKMFRVINHA